ncbi:hypothetical protein J3R75_003988 [Oligosphaera ethanolica]|uniref:Uncharacterized protein n=1 Tax=Oligosphaera ethanolica TaxID=760260 RepID=A0AAE4AQS7_9BACT|nr:hypothetical protein [Oligosphaera ethanolica]
MLWQGVSLYNTGSFRIIDRPLTPKIIKNFMRYPITDVGI